MIIPIAPADYDRHRQDFGVAVRNTFPMLGYSPEQARTFLTRWQAQNEGDCVLLIETRHGQAFARRIHWDIQYVIPSDWHRRYDILREALGEIKAEFLCSGAGELSLGINDAFPSHSLYYAGMLSMLGFEIHSGEIAFEAPDDLLDSLSLPALPLGVGEVRGDRVRLEEYAALYAEAHAARERRKPSGAELRQFEAILADAVPQEDMRITWVGLESEGRIVASCYGGCRPERWGNFLSVEELAVRPEVFGKGLGRYVLVRCLQELKRHYGVPGRPFQIGTWRHMGPLPLRLYLGLGFQIIKAETYATFWNPLAPEDERTALRVPAG